MSEENKIQIFEDKKIRTAWNESEEEWYFSIVDVISVLTDSNEPRRYWSDLKRKLKAEGANQLYENIVQLKMQSPKDGKNYKTDVANTEQLLRLIQSIPSPKAEPFKMWLAEVGRERIDETIDPELTIKFYCDTTNQDEEKDIKEITLYENGEYATIFITSPGGVKQNYKTSIDISELVI